MSIFTTQIGRALFKMLKVPGDWELRDVVIQHKPSKIYLWTSNGPFFCDVWDNTENSYTGYIERWFLYFVAQSVRRKLFKIRSKELSNKLLGRLEANK